MHLDILVVIVGYALMNTMLVSYFKGKDNETTKLVTYSNFSKKMSQGERTHLVNKSRFIFRNPT
jgi:hypothetical protein